MPSLDEAATVHTPSCRAMMVIFGMPVFVCVVMALFYLRYSRAAQTAAPPVRHQPVAADSTTSTETETPPLFLLVGDSTTADQAVDGGGWGAGFLSFLARGARGVNYGRNGATTRGYLGSGVWDEVIGIVRANATRRRVYVTIQFGHNDQNPSSGVSLEQYRTFLVTMARDVLKAGGAPILLTPLARRDFDADGRVVDNLKAHREATLAAYEEVLRGEAEDPDSDHASSLLHNSPARCFNLSAASLAYIGAIGREATLQYNLHGFDTTHLNEHGSTVFGRLVADLLLGHPPALVAPGERDKWAPGAGNDDDGRSAWIRPSPLLTGLIWHGKPA